MIGKNVLDLIGNTPLVEIKRLNPNPKVKIYAKLEYFNPGGSIKDRVALAMIERAEKLGEITNDKIIIEATSGNTGIGLAMVCAVKGYRLMLLMPESASEERKRILKAYGAELYLTPGHLSTDGAIEEAYRLAREEPHKYVLMDQFNNPASIDAHYQGTGLEIWKQTNGKVTHVVSALGTSGTAMGISKRLKELDSKIKVIGVEPYAGHAIQGLKNMQASYPPGIFERHRLDKIINIDDDTAFELARELAKKEGIFVGMSSGAALGGALTIARELEEGVVVVIFPDGGDRYLSTSLFVPPKKQGIKVHSLKTKEKQLLTFEDEMNLFTFGPSAESPLDVESFRRVLLIDSLSNYLKKKDINVKSIVGVADLDDQAVCKADQQGINIEQFSNDFIGILKKCAQRLLLGDVNFSAASKQESLMLKITQNILDKGRGYEKLRSVYFDVTKDKDYGTMTGADFSKLMIGKTVELDSYSKDNPRDFTLLKRATLKDLKRGDFIKTRWGNVRPSWYLQMAASIGENIKNIDLVLGGMNHFFPHLENLKAIWKYGLGISPKIWTAAGAPYADDPDLLKIDELLKLVSPQAIRMFLLSQSYHKPLHVTKENLKMWQKNQDRVQQCAINVKSIKDDVGDIRPQLNQILYNLKRGFYQAIEDDLKIYRFWPVLFDFCKKINSWFFKKDLTPKEAKLIWDKLKDVEDILKIIDPKKLPISTKQVDSKVKELLNKRLDAKNKKDFNKADELRSRLKELGFIVEDTPYGQRVFSIN